MQNPYELVIATDLDGTFLEGDLQVKETFYNQLTHLRDRIMLVYTTGRPVETVVRFCQQGDLPYPDFLLADHGTRIVDANFQLVPELQNQIIKKWNNGNHSLRELLRNDPGLELQPIDPPYRVAYYYEPQYLQPQTVEKIINAGYDAMLSCDVYLDILPKGINKGVSLMQLLNYLKISHDTVITCGDSLNDLSLFQTGLKSIAVGNSEPKLIAKIQELKNVYLSKFPGLHGIIDGLSFYKKNHLFSADLAISA